MIDDPEITDEMLQYDGFLRLREYCAKYGLKKTTVLGWVKASNMDCERKPWRHHTRGIMLVWHIVDKPPEEHLSYREFRKRDVRTPYTRNSIGNRKRIVKKFLIPFIESSNPEITKYSRPDLASILTITYHQVKTWELWGLPKTKFVGSKKIWSRDWYFAREDVIAFLKGEWEELRKRIIEGHDSAPTQIASSVSSDKQHTSTSDQSDTGGEGYYSYQEDKVFPIGYEGFMAWVKEMGVVREDKRLRKFVPIEFLPIQKEFFFKALALKENGDFKYHDVGACRPRGDFKSFDIRLMFLFRFFNMFREKILIAANSKEQSTFVQYDEAVTVIQQTERLLNTPGLDIKKKSIELIEGSGKTFSTIMSIASKTGLMPGTTCTVFTEICDLEDEGFYSKLTGSLRGVPNAMNLIDSTVAQPGHVFDRLLKSYEEGTNQMAYVQYYADEHHNPEISEEYLKNKEATMLPSEFSKYFRNRKEDAAGGVFPAFSIMEMGYSAASGGNIGPSKQLRDATLKTVELESQSKNQSKTMAERMACEQEIESIQSSLVSMGECYRIPVTLDGMASLASKFGYDFIFGVGVDRATTTSLVSTDRTAMALTARVILSETYSLYFLLDLYVSKKEATLEVLADKIEEWSNVVGWIDNVVIESYQGPDLHVWCEGRGYSSQLIHPNYPIQKQLFTAFCRLMKMGHFKAPVIPYYTDKEGNLYKGHDPERKDILREEMSVFMHKERTEKSGWFGAPEKRKKGGVKDDTVYATAMSILATQAEGSGMGGAGSTSDFSGAVVNEETAGMY